MTDLCGIYLLRNIVNGKVYVGQSVHVLRRWHEHKKCAKRGDKSHLYDAIRKYGADMFEHSVLEACTPERLDEREAYWMSLYDCRNPECGYNLLPAGQRGRVMDSICRERIASKLRGRKLSDERVHQMRLASLGRKHTEETKQKIRQANLGRRKGANSKLSEALKAYYAAMSDADRQAYADARKGFEHTPEARRVMSEKGLGRKHSDSTKAKHRERMLNEPSDVKQRRLEALREATKARWAKWRAEKELVCS